jgi:protocatechuate 3,4-dioxygenase beta subunit
MDHDDLHDHDRGLSHDLPTLLSRRRMLAALGGVGGLVALAGCDPGSSGASATASGAASPSDGGASPATGASAASGGQIPEETAGPYPGDGSNGVNVLTQSGIVRSDITRSFGSGSAVARGVPLTIRLTVTDTAKGAAALAGAAVYVWHCDIDGNYSLYANGLTGENYLRGVQETDASGLVTFTSIYPGAYSGRWPHIHFEVYPSLAKAGTASGKLRTSQLALPKAACETVYATDGYAQSASNLARSSLDTDMVFSDGYSLQLATVTGTVGQGMTAALTVPV